MNILILLAGGSGNRFGGDKIVKNIAEKPVFWHSLSMASACNEIDHIVLVVSQKNRETLASAQKEFPQIADIILGGETRFESTLKGFHVAKKLNADIVLFHNLANPGVTPEEFTGVIQAVKEVGAAGVGRQVTSTLRKESGEVLPRNGVYSMETPQGMTTAIFEKGVSLWKKKLMLQRNATSNDFSHPTDDLQVANISGVTPRILPVSSRNYKITTPDDLLFLENMFDPSKNPSDSLNKEKEKKKKKKKSRIGVGQDSHRFSDSGELILGGIFFPDSPKLSGNSDGDAVLHALTNAFSSALGGGSLSTFSDEMCEKGISDSSEYLNVVLKKLNQQKGNIENISLSIEAKKPKLEHRLSEMKKKIAQICGISENQIGITATSGESLTEVGKGLGIAVIANVMIRF